MLRQIAENETFTILLMLCLFLVTVSKLLFSNRFSSFLELTTNFKYIRAYSKNQGFFDFFDALLFCNLVAGITIFSYLGFNYFSSSTIDVNNFLFKFGFVIAIVILIKVLIERLTSSYLDVEDIIANYLFYKISYRNFIGLLLIPINFIVVFGIPINQTLIFICLGILFLINSIGIFSFVREHQNQLIPNIFYFILYLCALEISPYIILYKFIKDNMISVF